MLIVSIWKDRGLRRYFGLINWNGHVGTAPLTKIPFPSDAAERAERIYGEGKMDILPAAVLAKLISPEALML